MRGTLDIQRCEHVKSCIDDASMGGEHPSPPLALDPGRAGTIETEGTSMVRQQTRIKRCTRCRGTGSIAIGNEVLRCPKCQGLGSIGMLTDAADFERSQ